MAKDLPYFKFYPSEWISGDITIEDLRTQGLFINICCYYWSQECQVSFEKLQKRFKKNKKQIENLISSEIIYRDGEENKTIKIKFLDKQWSEREAVKLKNKANGIKGGRPRNNPMVNSGLAKNNPTITNIEEKREEEIRGENKSKPKNNEPENKQIDPEETAKPTPGSFEEFSKIYPKKFNPMCTFTRSSFFEAVSIAGNGDKILSAAAMYADYFTISEQPIQYAAKAQDWLESQAWRTDWNDETNKFQNKNGSRKSNSKPSIIKKGELF